VCCFQVRHEQEEAERVAAVVGAEEAEVAAKAAECQALKDDAAAELVRTLLQPTLADVVYVHSVCLWRHIMRLHVVFQLCCFAVRQQSLQQKNLDVVVAEEAEVAAKAAECQVLQDDAAAELVRDCSQQITLPQLKLAGVLRVHFMTYEDTLCGADDPCGVRR
jgi:hypothetical protein